TSTTPPGISRSAAALSMEASRRAKPSLDRPAVFGSIVGKSLAVACGRHAMDSIPTAAASEKNLMDFVTAVPPAKPTYLPLHFICPASFVRDVRREFPSLS